MVSAEVLSSISEAQADFKTCKQCGRQFLISPKKKLSFERKRCPECHKRLCKQLRTGVAIAVTIGTSWLIYSKFRSNDDSNSDDEIFKIDSDSAKDLYELSDIDVANIGVDMSLLNDAKDVVYPTEQSGYGEQNSRLKRYIVEMRAFKTGEWYKKTVTDNIGAAASAAKTANWGRAYRIIDSETGQILDEADEAPGMAASNGYPQ